MADIFYTTEELLCYALRMLDEAKHEQATSRRKRKWLKNNETLETIRSRVAEIESNNDRIRYTVTETRAA